MPSEKHGNIIKIIAQKTQPKEGPEAIRRILREAYRHKRITTKNLATQAQLPIPLTAAIRKELEKQGILKRDKGTTLTEKGRKLVEEQLGFIYTKKPTCSACKGKGIQIPKEIAHMLEKLEKHLKTRPKPLPWLDQAHATPETALFRAIFMLERGDVEGRRILFLGDDDFTSVAVGLLKAAKEIAVIDIDARLLKTIKRVAREEGYEVFCVEHDLRQPLPDDLMNRFDVVFTDPPYTLSGLGLFISRGVEAIQQSLGASIYLAYAHQPPGKMLRVQKVLSDMGLVVVEVAPRFNIYEGAEMFANTTSLIRLEVTEKAGPLISGAFGGKLYTGEISQTVRKYQCRCGELISVGATLHVQTIEDLKEQGCPKCGAKKGFALMERRKLKEELVGRLKLEDFRWKDFPTILEFEREISRKSFPKAPILDEEYHRQKLKKVMFHEPESLKVAVLDGKIVGWLWLRIEKDRSTDEKFGYIKSIIVKPEHRHQGFGRKLMEAAENHFLKKDVQRIDLIVSASNYEAAMFFEEVGFQREHSTLRKRLKKLEAD